MSENSAPEADTPISNLVKIIWTRPYLDYKVGDETEANPEMAAYLIRTGAVVEKATEKPKTKKKD